MYTKENLEVYRISDKKQTYRGVFFCRGFTLATDGYRLVLVTVPKSKKKEFFYIQEPFAKNQVFENMRKEESKDFGTIKVNPEEIRQALRNEPLTVYNEGVVEKNIFVFVDKREKEISVKGLSRLGEFELRAEQDDARRFLRVFPKERDKKAEAKLSVGSLVGLLEVFEKAGVKEISFKVFDDLVKLTGENSNTGQRVYGLLAQLRK